jgi:hypothetical protein
MSTFEFPVSEQADRSESEHAGFVTQMRLMSLPNVVKSVTAYKQINGTRVCGIVGVMSDGMSVKGICMNMGDLVV